MLLNVTDIYKIGQPALVIQNDSFLKITVWNSAAGVTPVQIRVNYEIITPIGEFKYGQEDIVPTIDRLPNIRFSTLQEGIISKVRVFASAGIILRGETYVLVELQKSNAVTPQVAQVLIAGYLTTGEALSFPGTPIQDPLTGAGNFITTTLVPGLVAAATYTQPVNSALKLISVLVIVTNTAAGANRWLRIITAGGGINVLPPVSSAFGPTIIKEASWQLMGAGQTMYSLPPPSLVNIESIPLPAGIVLRPADQVILTLDGAAGDNITTFAVYGEQFISI